MSRSFAKLKDLRPGDFIEVGQFKPGYPQDLPVGEVLEIKGEDSWRHGGNFYVQDGEKPYYIAWRDREDGTGLDGLYKVDPPNAGIAQR